MIKKEESKIALAKNIDEVTQDAKIEYPITFDIKVVIDASVSDKQNMINISVVFDKLKVENSYISNKKSSKGTYVSYNYKVILQSKSQLEQMYSNLKNVPGLKFAL